MLLALITGASRGIGAALVRSAPEPARVVGLSRGAPPAPAVHRPVDLSGPAGWDEAARCFADEVARGGFDRIVCFHVAATLDPIGFAGEIDPTEYRDAVLLNSASPQVLGDAFLRAVGGLDVDRHLVQLTSGAARSVYEGWSHYGAGKAAVDQWVRDVGAEQQRRGGVRVVSVAPGVVATAMQERIRRTDPRQLPSVQKFVDLHEHGELVPPDDVATRLWSLLDRPVENGAVLDLRNL